MIAQETWSMMATGRMARKRAMVPHSMKMVTNSMRVNGRKIVLKVKASFMEKMKIKSMRVK